MIIIILSFSCLCSTSLDRFVGLLNHCLFNSFLFQDTRLNRMLHFFHGFSTMFCNILTVG